METIWGPCQRSPSPAGFTRHNFSNYADSRFGSLLVTNDYGIVGGRDTEDDDSYRYRIHLKLTSQSGANENALRFALLQVPGIQDVVFDSKAGTFTCYVYAITTVASASVLQAVQDTLDREFRSRISHGKWQELFKKGGVAMRAEGPSRVPGHSTT